LALTITQKIRYLETEFFESIDLALKCYINQEIEEKDYSREYAALHTVLALEKYKRALSSLNENTINKISKNELFENMFSDFEKNHTNEDRKRLNDFYMDFYDSKRFDKLIDDFKCVLKGYDNTLGGNVKNIIDKNTKSVDDDSIDERFAEATENIEPILNVVDGANLLSGRMANLFTPLKNKVNYSFNKHNQLWRLFSNEIINHRNLLLVKPDEMNAWWFNYKPITASVIKEAINKDSIKAQQNNILIQELSNKFSDLMNKIPTPTNIFEQMRSLSKSFDENLDSFISTTKLQTLKAGVWSYKISSNDLYQHINKEVIRDLIKLVEDDGKIDDDTKHEILAVAYLILGQEHAAEEKLKEHD